MGITSLILGIISILLAFIPVCGIILCILPIILGIIFGIIGIVTEKGKRVPAIVGLCLSVAAGFIMFGVTIFWAIVLDEEDRNIETRYNTITSETRTNATYNMKETAYIDDMRVRINKAEKVEGTEEIKPKEGKEFILVTVNIQNYSRENVYYGPQNFKIKNAQKQLQRTVNNKIDEANGLEYGELMPGGSVTGTILFEVNKNSQNLSVLYSEDSDFDDTVEVRLKFE